MDEKIYPIPENLYKILKWLSITVLPVLAVFVGTVGEAWGLPYVQQIMVTINAIGALIAGCIMYSQNSASTVTIGNSKGEHDGD
jgi:hypothetical protein